MRIYLEDFKKLTGYTQADIARRFDCTRQHIAQQMRNYSMTHRNSSKYMLLVMAEEKIQELKKQIQKIESFKEDLS